MTKTAVDTTNISVLEPIPVSDLKKELEKYSHLPPHLTTAPATRIMQVTAQGAALLHDRCDKLSAGRNELNYRIFNRDACVAFRWARMTFYPAGNDDQVEGGWHE